MDMILKPFAWVMSFFYDITGQSYVLSLILFTLLIKIVLFPLSLKGKKSMMQMTSLQGKMKQLEKQYGKDKQRYQMEVQKLYAKEKVNPMGGCLWSLLPLPILIGVYGIIRRPLFYLMELTNDQVNAVIQAITDAGGSFAGNTAYHEIAVANMLNDPSMMQLAKDTVGDAADKLFAINFNFLGINLSGVPQWQFWKWDTVDWSTIGLFLIPILVTVLNVFASRISMKTNNYSGQSNPAADATSRQMMIIMPLMYLWFGYIMPGGMCIYMAVSAVTQMLQDFLCAKILRKEYAKLQEQREEQERLEKEEEKRLKAERAAQRALEAEEAKKNRGKKKHTADADKKKGPANEASRVGIRTYARGRAYDPDRFGGVTPYRDPSAPIDEEAVEKALQAKAGRAAAAAEDQEAENEVSPEESAVREPEAALEAPAEEASPEEAAAEEAEAGSSGGQESGKAQEDEEPEI